MDINSNRGSHAASKPKHISRLRKEMLQHRMHHNPFSSPPSSTGSHDTVSTTTEELTQNLSNFSFSPDDEGTRRFGDDFHTQNKRRATRSGRFGSKQMPDAVLNTSAIARTFPEWSGLLAKDNAAFIQTLDMAAPIRSASTARAEKENVPPAPESTQEHTLDDASESRRKRPRPDMQARVENESDCSTVLSLSPGRPALAARRSRFATSQPAGPRSPEPPKRSLQDMVSKIRTEKQTTKQDVSPRRSPSREVAQPHRQTPEPGLAVDDTRVSPASRSFFLPAFRHLPDWASGTLRFSTMKNGVPVFVKSGKSGVRLEQSGKNHGDLRAVSIPKEDEQIFVSMDKLQEEVRELHDHDAMLQREAERLQREVNQLQAELKRLKSRKLADSAIGSDSDGSFRRSGGHGQDLESQIAQLRDRLDQASRQVGVNDIHSAALAAERDEALHQASVARERAAKLQAELEAVQKDLESSLQLLHAKETLQLENASLLAENVALSEQRDAAVHSNKTLSAENERLHLELARAQKDLARTREELASVRKQYEAVQEQKRKLAQDHASMERSNENYSKENKRLQAQVAAREKHIADLKKGISSRDKMIDKIQGITTDTAMLEANADLEAEVEHLQKKIEQQSVELHQKDGEISAKEGRIRSLKEKNLDLSIDNERLRAENQRLHAEHEEIRSQWVDERQKAVRLDQLVAKNNLHDTRDDCIFLDDDFNQKEAALRQKLERREAAVKKVKQLSSKISQIAEQEFMGKTAKVARVLDPKDMQTATDESSGKSTALHVDDDPTTEIHLTQGSDFASVMEGELARLKQTYRDLQSRQQQGIDSEAAGNTAQMAEFALPTLHPALHRSKSDSSAMPSKAAQSKNQPSGVLKKSSQFIAEEDTGRFSVESALSIVSHHTDDELLDTFQNRKPSGPARRVSRLRRNSEADREPTETEPNMTSAFFMPDITLEGKNKQSTSEPQQSEQHQPQQQQQPVPSLSKDARRVLDGICKHNSTNCNVCVRIAAHGDKHASTATRVAITAEDVQRGKKIVSADKPVPVSDRGPEPAKQPPAAEEQPTVRPAMAPGEALAVLIKETQDEIDHLQMELRRLNDVYFGLDKALGQRERRRVMGEIKRLQGELEAKSGHLYRLHDVLEGQKLAGQLMAGEAVDVTVLSGLVRAEVLAGQGEREWVGFD